MVAGDTERKLTYAALTSVIELAELSNKMKVFTLDHYTSLIPFHWFGVSLLFYQFKTDVIII